MTAATVCAGCVPAAGTTHTAYVLLPYVAGAACVAAVVWLMIGLTGGGDPMREHEYEVTAKRFFLRSVLAAAFSGCALLGDLVYLALHGMEGKTAGTLAFLACQVVTAVCAVAWNRYFNKLNWSN
jgi:hypothetical protein